MIPDTHACDLPDCIDIATHPGTQVPDSIYRSWERVRHVRHPHKLSVRECCSSQDVIRAQKLGVPLTWWAGNWYEQRDWTLCGTAVSIREHQPWNWIDDTTAEYAHVSQLCAKCMDHVTTTPGVGADDLPACLRREFWRRGGLDADALQEAQDHLRNHMDAVGCIIGSGDVMRYHRDHYWGTHWLCRNCGSTSNPGWHSGEPVCVSCFGEPVRVHASLGDASKREAKQMPVIIDRPKLSCIPAEEG